MNTILSVGIILIVFSFLLRNNKSIPPYWGFLLVLLIMGFQEGVEGDFMTYKEKFDSLARSGHEEATAGAFEFGWLILRRLFSWGPFWLFVLCISLFQSAILCKLTHKYCERKYQYLAAILFFFTFQMMLWQMKALRQGLAIELMALAFLFVDEKKSYWSPLLCAFIAFTIHNSSLIIVPFLLVYYFKKNNKEFGHSGRKHRWLNSRFFPVYTTVLYFFLYAIKITFLQQYITPLALLMMNNTGSHLVGYLDESNTQEGIFALMDLEEGTSPLLVAYDAIIVFVVSWYYQMASSKMRVFSLISIIAAFGDMLFFGLGSLPRLFMYYTVFNIIVYPSVCQQINNKYGKMVAFVFVVLLIAYAWKTSVPWMIATEGGRFGTYHFIFLN